MRWSGVFAVLLLLGAGAVPAAAQPARDHARAGRVQALDQILPQIRRSRPGTFYDAEGPFRGADGRMHYRLKWMTPGGRIEWLDTDAATGRVLGRARDARAPAWEQQRGEGRRYAPRDNRHGDRSRGYRPGRRDEFRGGPRYDQRRYAPSNKARPVPRHRARPRAHGRDGGARSGHDRRRDGRGGRRY